MRYPHHFAHGRTCNSRHIEFLFPPCQRDVEAASDFDYPEATLHLWVTEAARRTRQLMPPPPVLAFTYSFSRNSSSFVWAVRLIANLPLDQVSRVAHFALHACCAKYPDRPLDVLRSIAPAQRGGLPQIPEGSASAAILSGPAQASLALRTCVLAQPPCRGLLSRGFENHGCLGAVTSPDSYRGASTIPRAGLAPAGEVHPHGAQENRSRPRAPHGSLAQGSSDTRPLTVHLLFGPGGVERHGRRGALVATDVMLNIAPGAP